MTDNLPQVSFIETSWDHCLKLNAHQHTHSHTHSMAGRELQVCSNSRCMDNPFHYLHKAKSPYQEHSWVCSTEISLVGMRLPRIPADRLWKGAAVLKHRPMLFLLWQTGIPAVSVIGTLDGTFRLIQQCISLFALQPDIHLFKVLFI